MKKKRRKQRQTKHLRRWKAKKNPEKSKLVWMMKNNKCAKTLRSLKKTFSLIFFVQKLRKWRLLWRKEKITAVP